MSASASEHELIHADPFRYCAHPHAVQRSDGAILVVFNRAPRRQAILHPPQDPHFENVLTSSRDGGRCWSAPSVVPDYGWSGVECAGLTVTRKGRVLLNQLRFRWYPLPLARLKAAEESIAFPREWVGGLATSEELDSGAAFAADPERLAPWARGPPRAFVHASEDGGESFTRTVEISTGPYHGGYGMRGAVELADGTLVLPLGDVPRYERAFVVHSHDGGISWGKPVLVAYEAGRLFEEPAPLLLPSGRILLALRESRARTIFTVHSDDAGRSWSRPEPTGIRGFPAHLLQLDDGRILCTYGVREPPYAIRAVISVDGGTTWDIANPISIREPLLNKDLGYPCTLRLAADELLTIYYAQGSDGITGIWRSRWAPK